MVGLSFCIITSSSVALVVLNFTSLLTQQRKVVAELTAIVGAWSCYMSAEFALRNANNFKSSKKRVTFFFLKSKAHKAAKGVMNVTYMNHCLVFLTPILTIESLHLYSRRCIYLRFIEFIHLKMAALSQTGKVFPMQASTSPAGGGNGSHLNIEDNNRGRAEQQSHFQHHQPPPSSSQIQPTSAQSGAFLSSLRPNPATDTRYFIRPL